MLRSGKNICLRDSLKSTLSLKKHLCGLGVLIISEFIFIESLMFGTALYFFDVVFQFDVDIIDPSISWIQVYAESYFLNF